MRTLKTPVAGLPAGTKYDVIQTDPGAVRRLVWIAPQGWRCSARVDGQGQLAAITAAGPIYDAHVAHLGCNPEEPIPCGFCGEEIAACLTLCPECGKDPDADVDCEECQDHTGRPTGEVEYCEGDGQRGRREVCRGCQGALKVEPPYAGPRQAQLDMARGWKRAQSDEANPVPVGIGGGR
jgi:hypothetical protein